MSGTAQPLPSPARRVLTLTVAPPLARSFLEITPTSYVLVHQGKGGLQSSLGTIKKVTPLHRRGWLLGRAVGITGHHLASHLTATSQGTT